MVVVVMDIPGGNQQQYDRITATVFPDGTIPDGWIMHVSGPTENGWRVINVVPSQEQFESFARERVFPAAQTAGDAPPVLTFFPVYRLIQN